MTPTELQERIQLNFNRMCDECYQIHHIFQPSDYAWPGDWEGRALLAFVCLARMTGREIDCMHRMVEQLEEKTAGRGYFGPTPQGMANEQQLSGHSWYLRGLIAYDSEFPSETVKRYIYNTFEKLYLPARDCYAVYPIEQNGVYKGGVSGEQRAICGCWKLSTDIGCAFMAIDGVSDYYAYTGDARALPLLETMIEVCMRFDRLQNHAQTHATLSAARGILRLWHSTGESKYLQYARSLFSLYEQNGMTLSYENCNWFKRPLWTEPCCIVDSLLLSVELYHITKETHYRTLARRILHNGLAFCQRSNGGAGTDACVRDGAPYLYTESCYEAYFCCTMRLSEGLLCAQKNQDLLFDGLDLSAPVTRDSKGRYFCGDLLLCEDVSEPGIIDASQPNICFEVDGRRLIPILPLYKFPQELAEQVKLRILF